MRRSLYYLLIAASAAFAVIAPFRYVIPAYMPPFVANLPADFSPIKQTLSPWAEVLGYQMEPAGARPGETVRVKVFMRALRPPEFNWSLVTNLYGRDNAPLGRFDTFTGGGLLPSSTWQPGQTWVDTVQFTVPQDALAPTILRVQFGLYNAGSGEIAPSLDVNGNATAPLYDGSTLLPTPTPLEVQPRARFGDIAQLTQAATEYRAEVLTVDLRWQAIQRATTNYVVFVHLLDAAGNRMAQGDAPPLSGQFPSTRWQSGVTFEESRTVQLPTPLPYGTYTVLMGLYDPHTGARLPATDAQGNRAKDDAFVVGTIHVP